MKKKQKIAFISGVKRYFEEAPNHGNGGNWWHPTQNRIAYDVKMHNWSSVEELRKYMSPLQNEYYSNEHLENILQDEQEQTCEMLIEDVNMNYDVTVAGFAGRSGGWIEIDYINNLEDIDEDEEDESFIDEQLKEAIKLDELQEDVKAFIKENHQNYNNYIDTEDFYKDIIDFLEDDESIKAINIDRLQLRDMLLHKDANVRRHASGIKKQLIK